MELSVIQRRIALPTVLITALIVLIVALPSWLQNSPSGAPHLSQAQCDIGDQNCTTRLSDDRMVGMHIQTANGSQIKSLMPLTFVAQLPDSVQHATLELTGREMYMGINRIPLMRVADGGNQWQAETELAVCTSGSMVWQARLITGSENPDTLAIFEFMAH